MMIVITLPVILLEVLLRLRLLGMPVHEYEVLNDLFYIAK